MLKKFFWEGVSSCLFTVLGLCMIAVAVKPGLAFDNCRGCHKTTALYSCTSSDVSNHCSDEGCRGHDYNREECAKCVCVKITNNECECQSPSTTGE